MIKQTRFIITSALILSLVFTLQVSALTITNVDSPKQIQPGQSEDITLTIRNDLDEDFENIRVSLNLNNQPFSPYQSGSEEIIEDLNEGKSKEVDFTLQADSNAKAGVYKIPVILSYNNTQETDYISLTINAKPEIQINSENYLIKGRNNELNIKFVNTGLTDIKFLTVRIQDSGFQTISSKEVYIGDIDSNDFDSASYDVFVDSQASGIISVPVTLTYRDSLNNEFAETRSVSLKAYSNQEAIKLGLVKKSNTATIIIVLVSLLVLYLIYRFVKKRLKNKKKEM